MSRHVLLAEDDAVTLDLLRFNLERCGFSVVATRDGQLALKAAAEQHFDCVITDFDMPRLNGEAFCKAFRDIEHQSNTPVVLCSGKSLGLEKQRLQDEYGLRTVLPKPFSPREMVRLVQEITGKQTGNRD